MTTLKKSLLSLLMLLISLAVFAQKYTIHGYIKDHDNGEGLIGASVIISDPASGTVTNVYGFYSLSLPAGNYTLVYSYLGYTDVEKQFQLESDLSISVELIPTSEQIDEVVINAEAKNHNVVSTRMSVDKIDSKTIDKIPVLLGEVDVIKALRLLPGVVSTSEMSSNLSVRGGAYDQNMFLLDEANVYNASHLLGLFSVFNNDAVKNVEMFKGVFPAQYGGRLSSVVDVRLREGNTKQFSAVGSIGLLTSKLTLEAPIVKDKGSVLISARRTYLDLVTKALHGMNSEVAVVPYYFHDYYLKANYALNNKHHIYLSGYFGRDDASFDLSAENKQTITWGNYTGTVRWNYNISNKLFANFTAITSNYDYLLVSESKYGKNKEKSQKFGWDAFLKDYSLKADFNYFMNPSNTLKFGTLATYHDFNVGNIEGNVDTMQFRFSIPKYYSLEYALYASNSQKINENILFEYGMRLSMFQNIGSATQYTINEYEVTDTLEYGRNEVFNTYFGLEPRFASTYIINSQNSIKAGYSRTAQFLHVASNSNSGTPLDMWMPATPYVKPQYANQVNVGYFSNVFDNILGFSVESYFKKMNNQIEFKEFSQPYFNPQIETDFRFGNARSYGLELMLKKSEGRFTGWASYTLAKSERKTKDIQEKNWYPSPYDHRHNVSLVGMFDVSKRISLSANWVFLSGNPFNAPSARWVYGNVTYPYYTGKNGSLYPNYHRLDLGVEIKTKKKGRYESSWSFSVYNLYNRKNANLIYFTPVEGNTTQAYKYSMLQRIYSFSYNFKF